MDLPQTRKSSLESSVIFMLAKLDLHGLTTGNSFLAVGCAVPPRKCTHSCTSTFVCGSRNSILPLPLIYMALCVTDVTKYSRPTRLCGPLSFLVTSTMATCFANELFLQTIPRRRDGDGGWRGGGGGDKGTGLRTCSLQGWIVNYESQVLSA